MQQERTHALSRTLIYTLNKHTFKKRHRFWDLRTMIIVNCWFKIFNLYVAHSSSFPKKDRKFFSITPQKIEEFISFKLLDFGQKINTMNCNNSLAAFRFYDENEIFWWQIVLSTSLYISSQIFVSDIFRNKSLETLLKDIVFPVLC